MLLFILLFQFPLFLQLLLLLQLLLIFNELLIFCQLPILLPSTPPNLSALLEPPVPLDLLLLAYTSASLQCPGVSALLSLTTKMQFPLFIALSHLSSCSTDSSAQESYKSFTGCSDKK